MSIVSISMPEALLERIDTFADEHGYSGRSEVFREASRKLLEEIAGFVNTVRAIPTFGRLSIRYCCSVLNSPKKPFSRVRLTCHTEAPSGGPNIRKWPIQGKQ